MKTLRVAFLIFLLVSVSAYNACGQDFLDEEQPYKILKGTISRKDYQSYVKVPFLLPEGVKRLSVKFSYNKKEERTTIDLGVMDPGQKIRGWSGGARNGFTLSKEDATPGYFPGPIASGRWTLLLGVPNIREGIKADYEAKIYIETRTGITEFSDRPLRMEAGWYRGDLHVHSGNSDSKCTSQSGNKIPSPVYRIAEFAANNALDFVALTDHNTTSQAEELRELQTSFDKVLLVPGEEITTFFGHANVFGLTDLLDFKTLRPSYSEAKKWMDVARRAGGILSINHPGIPSGENCMGCGWQIDSIPPGVITAVEVINGGSLRYSTEGPIQGWDLWHKMLKTGRHITAIGGSDNHTAGEPTREAGSIGTIGNPTTVIYMKELSVKGLIAGICSGRVFVDIEGNKDRFLDLSASDGNNKVFMGSTLDVSHSEWINLKTTVRGVPEGRLEFIVDGEVDAGLSRDISLGEEILSTKWKTKSGNHFIYVKVRDKKGKLLLLSNPVYINNK